jgi:LysM domain
MNSVKNLMVVVLLMGVSYGAFQVINTPDPVLNPSSPGQALDITQGAPQADILDKPLPGLQPLNPEPDSDTTLNPPTLSSPMNLPEKGLSLPSLPPGVNEFAANPPSVPRDPPSLANVPELSPRLPAENSLAGKTVPTGAGMAGGGSFAPTSGGTFTPPAATTPTDNLTNNSNFPEGSAPPLAAASPGLLPVVPKPDLTTNPAPFTPPPAGSASPFAPPAPTQPVAAPPASVPAETLVMATPPGTITQLPPENANPAPSQPAAAATIDWDAIAATANAGKPRDALAELSAFYDKPLPADQRMKLLEWLDLLAGKVIYSTEHHLESRPHIVAAGETIESIARRWNVPPELVYNVNQSKVGNSSGLMPGMELKIIPGPFNARISIDRMEMTLFLNDLYAGRFPVEMGKDAAIQHGSFMVESRSGNGREYVAAPGQSIPPASPNNPYGQFWIGLGDGNPCIHEATTMGSGTDFSGCIRMASRDARDVYGILSEGSQISILR